jgi:predicted TIM-barrel fold metal-dependent hydrolase
MSSRYEGPIIDAHHHLWDMSLNRHPWLTSEEGAIKALGDITYLKQDYLIDDLLADIGPQNVTGSVYVEAAWDRSRPPVEEIEWLESLEKPGRIAGRSIGFAPLKSPGIDRTLETLAARPSLAGIREVIRWHPDPARRWTEPGVVDDPAWRRGLEQLGARGLLLELLMNPYQSAEVARLAATYPEQIFIINHCATPIDRDAEGLARWRDGLKLMSARDNIAIKVSNFGAYGQERGLTAWRDTVMTCVDAFGTKRCLGHRPASLDQRTAQPVPRQCGPLLRLRPRIGEGGRRLRAGPPRVRGC